MKEKLFLITSKQAALRLTNLFDFVWPTAAAMWNLRWQVQGYVANSVNPTDEDLYGRFVKGSGIRGANLKRSCLETTWEDQQQEFARFLLVEICAIYETWCEGALSELGLNGKYSKSMQYPTTFSGGNPTRGVGCFLLVALAKQSPVTSTCIYPALISSSRHDFPRIEELLVCYRYFKELRNSMVHSGGTSSQEFIDAETEFLQLTGAQMGLRERPEHETQILGGGVKINLRGVVGFGEVALKLICTLDAELSKSQSAEELFAARWRATNSVGITIATKRSARVERIKRMTRKIDLPTPVSISVLDAWLCTNRFVV